MTDMKENTFWIQKTFWSSSSLFPVSLKQVMVSSERFNQLTKNHYLSNNPNKSNDDKSTNKQSSNDLKLSNVKLQLLEDQSVHHWSRVWSTSFSKYRPSSRPRVQTTGSGTQNPGTPFLKTRIKKLLLLPIIADNRSLLLQWCICSKNLFSWSIIHNL